MSGDALDAIKAEALADAPAAAKPGDPNAQQQPGAQQPLTEEQQFEVEARSWAEIPATFGSVVTMGVPELQEVYTDDNCMEWGRAMVPIARRYEWKAGSGMAWLKLIGVTFALVRPTVHAIVKRRRAKAAATANPNAGQAGGEEVKVSRPAPASVND